MTALTDEQIDQAVSAYKEHGSVRKAAEAIGLGKSAFHQRLQAAALKGQLGYDPVLPGFEIKNTTTRYNRDGEIIQQSVRQAPEYGGPFSMPAGHLNKGVSALLNQEGRIIAQWVKTRLDTEPDWCEVFKNAFAEYEGRAEPLTLETSPDANYANFFPCNDWHINMLCWEREVGDNWDLKIAEKTIGKAIESMIARTRPAGIAVVLGGGDLMHNDDNSNRTAKSGNVLDADGRHAKGIEVAQRLKVKVIDAVLRNNGKVIVRILKGNHDEQSAVAIAHFLAAWYRNEPRVTVDLDQSLFWFFRFGKVFLSATHGHAAKLKDMPGIMAHRRPEDWGKTRFRYAHGFHVHHKERMATEGNGVICEYHQAPIPKDAWHFGEGYLSNRSLMSITYHKDLGEFGRIVEGIPDE